MTSLGSVSKVSLGERGQCAQLPRPSFAQKTPPPCSITIPLNLDPSVILSTLNSDNFTISSLQIGATLGAPLPQSSHRLLVPTFWTSPPCHRPLQPHTQRRYPHPHHRYRPQPRTGHLRQQHHPRPHCQRQHRSPQDPTGHSHAIGIVFRRHWLTIGGGLVSL